MMERVVGKIPVLESLRAGKRPARRLFVLRGGQGLDPILQARGNVPVEECGRPELDALSDGVVHQGVVLEAEPLPVHNAEEWVRGPFPEDAVAVVLDEVEDPHNFGAIVRSAAACGACAVVFGKHRSAPISPVSVKSAAGAMEYIELVRATNLARTLEGLKEAGFWIAALDPEGDQVLWNADLKGRIAIVVGSEGKGIRRLVLESCDFRLRIPLQGAITSLNASVSASVALVECLRQRAAH
ncbi:MAG: rRNA (guanosine2251-2-O)-methyltransferase [Candidatus Hydrogenedentes bacterium]|nr:rRNA (guanosine2251-2-O)-methyltransferase [Candidatus Hydrogenedentota bacterium]